MMISTKGRYALRVMIDIAEHQHDGYIPLKEIAARQEISEKYLEAIVKGLVKERYPDRSARQVRRLPPDQSARGVHRRQHPAPERGQPGPGGLPGAEPRGVPPHGRVPHPADVAQAEYDDQRHFDGITLADLVNTSQPGNDYVI